MSGTGFLGSFLGGLFGSILGLTILGIVINRQSINDENAKKSLSDGAPVSDYNDQ
jgi:hypothetical protein